ncbi:acetylornithine transaminase [Trueperella abortisuis]|uniref:Acetylornithine aminotransferase n=1 Tax=Trueperella abortisuis TaxID=445930 RepID=A0ABT9PIJ0_9ACTO|nr:acetylornithine transaminase [Trueperella abortisuis]MDP9832519.1 acetylornithine aminotransferase [Trueperella abortisuis]
MSELYSQRMMNAFGEPQLVIERGEGVYVWDENGKRYLDLLAGIAVNALGYAHPAIVRAITEQAGRATHVSNYFATAPQLELAGAIQRMLSDEGYVGASARVFFCNSGAEANEAAIKMARLHKPRGTIIALKGGFHGRTLGALSITHKPAIREPFEPLGGNVIFIDPSVEALDAVFNDDVAAIFVETIQGEAGVVPVPAAFLRRARALCERFNALFVVDEVQTGVGRTGRWFAHSDLVKADVIALAKGLGGGVPIGAVVGIEKAGRLLTPGSHGTTFGGNPLACAAANAVVGEVAGLLDHVRGTGQWLAGELEARGFEVRGAGLLLGVVVKDAPALQAELLGRGFIVNAPNTTTIRLAPPLVITQDELAPFIEEMEKHS